MKKQNQEFKPFGLIQIILAIACKIKNLLKNKGV